MYKVMIADDEPMVRKGFIHLINWHDIGCELTYAAVDGRDLLDNLNVYQPDIIISDVKMPRVDGIEAAQYIWENQIKTKFILLTAYADFSYAKSAIKYGVVEYVTKTGALEGIIEAIEKAKVLIERERSESNAVNLDLLKTNLLKSILDSSLFNHEEMLSLSEKYKINLEKYVVLAIKLDSIEEEDLHKSQLYMKISNFFKIAFNEYSTYVIPLSREMLCVVVNGLVSDNTQRIISICQEVLITIENFNNYSVYIGVSLSSHSILKLYETYQQAASAITDRFLNETSKIYSYSSLDPAAPLYSAQNDQFVEKIIQEIEKGLTKTALQYLEQLLLIQQLHSFSEKDIKYTGLIIESNCKKFISAYSATSTSTANVNASDLAGHANTIVESRFFSEYADRLKQIVTKTCDLIYEATRGKNNIILEALNYINANFERNITLNEIATHINVNSSYLSRMFKEKTGDTIMNTIHLKKIEKAKSYLINSNMKIQEIAEAIGIDDNTYFSHFFKKHTGLSPKQYKDAH
ncbi:response regulator [Paenibacillus sp. LHD-38]|uniref:response regulator n=1 Tax=Paenibacillus sp. LHD-38 TaxID=3072143 RepID=UPI00280E18A6|nr:response regulator [Paenibacillus sp. LHD-38]MDQ8734791.1 response regulator [Paenibacillus sp. LHD-38]